MRAGNQTTPVAPHLSLWDTVSIIIGIVVGAGIYETPPLVFQNTPSAVVSLGVWALAGILMFVGALCYAELATTYPRSGGDYVYLTRAYGPPAGFLFGWCQLAVLMTGSIGMMAYIFADYATNIWRGAPFLYAAIAVVVLSLANIAGVVFGKTAQNILTALKVVGLTAIIIAGFVASTPTTAQVTAQGGSLIGLAMVFVLYTYGGWNDAALVSAEVVENPRTIPRALMLGTGGVIAIYLLINGAYLAALGFSGARSAHAIAAEVLTRGFGGFAGKAMSLLVMISALGAVNGMIYTGSRIYAAVGADYPLFGWLSAWNVRRGSPVRSLVAQMLITLLLMALVGTTAGRSLVSAVFSRFSSAEVKWAGHGGFDTLLQCTAPVFWFFFAMTALSAILLRLKDRDVPRPFSVPAFPILPLVFLSTCLYMLYRAGTYAGSLILIGIIPLAMGIVIYMVVGGPRPANLGKSEQPLPQGTVMKG